MALSRSFKDTVKARAERDPEFRATLLGEAVEAFAAGDADSSSLLVKQGTRFPSKCGRPSGSRRTHLLVASRITAEVIELRLLCEKLS